jgi:hypothetical protein
LETAALPTRASELGPGAGGISRPVFGARQQPTSAHPTRAGKRFPVSSGPSQPPEQAKMLRQRAADGGGGRHRAVGFAVCDIPALCTISRRALPQTRLHTRFPALNQSVKTLVRWATAAPCGVDRAQRMIPTNPSFDIDVAEQRSRPLVLAWHDSIPRLRVKTESHRNSLASAFSTGS